MGQEILPRGSGICTRRPLVLQMVTCPASEGETATFLHKRNQVFDISKSCGACALLGRRLWDPCALAG